jgi:hypothetical protein
LSLTLRCVIGLCLTGLVLPCAAMYGTIRSKRYRSAADLLGGAIVRYEVAENDPVVLADLKLKLADSAATFIIQLPLPPVRL